MADIVTVRSTRIDVTMALIGCIDDPMSYGRRVVVERIRKVSQLKL